MLMATYAGFASLASMETSLTLDENLNALLKAFFQNLPDFLSISFVYEKALTGVRAESVQEQNQNW
jgi:hypothetical protein